MDQRKSANNIEQKKEKNELILLKIIKNRKKFKTKDFPENYIHLFKILQNPKFCYNEEEDSIFYKDSEDQAIQLLDEEDFEIMIQEFEKKSGESQATQIKILTLHLIPKFEACDEDYFSDPILEIHHNLNSSQLTFGLPNNQSDIWPEDDQELFLSFGGTNNNNFSRDFVSDSDSFHKRIKELIDETETKFDHQEKKQVLTSFERSTKKKPPLNQPERPHDYNQNFSLEDFTFDEKENTEHQEREDKIRNQLSEGLNPDQKTKNESKCKKRKLSFKKIKKRAKIITNVGSKIASTLKRDTIKACNSLKGKVSVKIKEFKAKHHFSELTEEDIKKIESMRENYWNGSSEDTEEQEDGFKVLNLNLKCSHCEEELKGIHFRCFVCPNYNLCQSCESEAIHELHPMVRFFDVDIKADKLLLPENWAEMGDEVNSHYEKEREKEIYQQKESLIKLSRISNGILF